MQLYYMFTQTIHLAIYQYSHQLKISVEILLTFYFLPVFSLKL